MLLIFFAQTANGEWSAYCKVCNPECVVTEFAKTGATDADDIAASINSCDGQDRTLELVIDDESLRELSEALIAANQDTSSRTSNLQYGVNMQNICRTTGIGCFVADDTASPRGTERTAATYAVECASVNDFMNVLDAVGIDDIAASQGDERRDGSGKGIDLAATIADVYSAIKDKSLVATPRAAAAP